MGGIVPHQTLGTIMNLLKHDDAMRRGIQRAFTQAADAKWLLGELPSHLEPIVAVRNPAAHGSRMTKGGRDRGSGTGDGDRV